MTSQLLWGSRRRRAPFGPPGLSLSRYVQAEAQVTFDKFHVMKLLNAAVGEVRGQEQKERRELKQTRYLWPKPAATGRAGTSSS